jgi:subtilisin family serine protease
MRLNWIRLFAVAAGLGACSPSTPMDTADMSTNGMPDLSTPPSGANCDESPAQADGAEDPFLALQWHLKNAQGGVDLNLGNTWESNRGDGILVAVVDDGVELRHEDLAVNMKAGGSLNFWAGQEGFPASATDPTPQNPAKGDPPAHGTAVAGLIAGRDRNGLGIRGIAPRACLSGINLIATGGNTPIQEAQAMNHRMAEMGLSNNSWGSTDGLGRPDGGSMEWSDAIACGLTTGRGGKGTIYLWAAGNGAKTTVAANTGFEADNSNLDGQANDPGVLAICGVMDDGKRVNYSERGANLWVCGFSETTTYDNDNRGTTSTDLSGMQGYNARAAAAGTTIDGRDYQNGNYTQGFNGTSAATPTVAGVVTLILKQNPALTWRDVRLILAESARQNDPTNGEWQINKGTRVSGQGGYRINHNYGFGLADVSAALQLARTWTLLPPRAASFDSGVKAAGAAFTDNNTTGAQDSIPGQRQRHHPHRGHGGVPDRDR